MITCKCKDVGDGGICLGCHDFEMDVERRRVDELVRALRAQAGAMCALDGTIALLDKYKDVK